MASLTNVAHEHLVSVTVIKNFLRERGFATDSRDFAGGEANLTRDEVRAIEAAARERRLVPRKQPDLSSKGHERERRVISSADLAGLSGASPSDEDATPRGQTQYPIYAHEDVMTALGDDATPDAVRKNLTRRVQELVAHGRATRTKGVKGPNAGYRRISLGGNSGSQYYLWFVVRGEKVAGQDSASFYANFPEHARILRAVRHHDETYKRQQLRLGTQRDYASFEPAVVMINPEDEGMREPLVPAQALIVSDRCPIRFIQGQPGAGKTTSLLAATRRLSGRLLYLTWSEGLATRAREWLDVSRPEQLDCVVWTFEQLLTFLDPDAALIRAGSMTEHLATLERVLATHRARLGAWSRGGELRVAELYAELHAHLFGAALPVDFRGRSASGDGALSRADYLDLREELGDAAAHALDAGRILEPDQVTELFPGPAQAFARAQALANGQLNLDPERFSFDWVLIDEVQDLTLIEQWLVVDVAARSGVARGVRPGFIVAGDEAQTVRPTAFEWGALGQMVGERFGTRDQDTQKHPLDTNLRSPRTIARFIDRVRSKLYRRLDKRQRPRGRVDASQTETTIGRLLLVETAGEHLDEVFRLFARAQPDAALVHTGALIPEPLREAAARAETTVWTSELVKGLEFRIVGVFDVPEVITEITELARAAEREPVFGELARSAIDRFLVATSRSTETLVLLSPTWGPAELETIAVLLEDDADADAGFLGLVPQAELEATLELDAADAREQIDRLLEQSEQLQSRGELGVAFQMAQNALGLLGPAGSPGSAGTELRRRVRRRYGVLAAHDAVARRDFQAMRKASEKLRYATRKSASQAVLKLENILTSDPRELPAVRALHALAELLNTLARDEPSLVQPVTETLLEHLEHLCRDDKKLPRTPMGRDEFSDALELLSSSAPSARRRFDDIEQTLLIHLLSQIVEFPGKAAQMEFKHLRARARPDPELRRIDARHAEAEGDHAGALRAWEELRETEAAVRCARKLGDLRELERVAQALGSDELDQIAWCVSVLDQLDAQPPGSLAPKDEQMLRQAFAARFPDNRKSKR